MPLEFLSLSRVFKSRGRFGPRPSPAALGFLGAPSTRLFVAEALVHAADISNPLKPRAIAAAWTDRLVEEFCLQVERKSAHAPAKSEARTKSSWK